MVLTSLFESTEFWAAVIGAVIGGGITILSQFLFWRHAVRFQERRRLLTAFFKLCDIHSHNANLLAHLLEGEADCKARGYDSIDYAFSRPLTFVPETPSFSDDEKAALSTIPGPIVGEVLETEIRSRGLAEQYRSYAASHLELQWSTPAKVSGTIGTTEMSKQEYLAFAPKAARLTDTLQGLLEIAKNIAQDSEQTVEKYKAAVQTVHKVKIDAELTRTVNDILRMDRRA
jgi:hypothetical protein